MKHMTDKKELLSNFNKLTEVNQGYVLSVTRALGFAQKTTASKTQNDNQPHSLRV